MVNTKVCLRELLNFFLKISIIIVFRSIEVERFYSVLKIFKDNTVIKVIFRITDTNLNYVLNSTKNEVVYVYLERTIKDVIGKNVSVVNEVDVFAVNDHILDFFNGKNSVNEINTKQVFMIVFYSVRVMIGENVYLNIYVNVLVKIRKICIEISKNKTDIFSIFSIGVVENGIYSIRARLTENRVILSKMKENVSTDL